jgi:ABC-type glycerol-3-phosphate transport system substrate-binding protein
MTRFIMLAFVLLLSACGSDEAITRTTTTTSGPSVSPTTTVQTTHTEIDD